MSDIVERCRKNQCPENTGCNTNPNCSCADLEDAADTIEQLRAELAALREQEPVRFERRSFRKGELFRDWHTSTASEVKSIGERTRFVNELGEEWIHETRKLYTTPRPTIPEGYVLLPIQPNEAMLDVILNTHDVYGFAADLYKALLDAAKETDHGN
jgi:hypothetical protein